MLNGQVLAEHSGQIGWLYWDREARLAGMVTVG